MKENYNNMDEFIHDYVEEVYRTDGEVKDYKYIKTITYPKCPFLYRDIYMNKKEEAYFFDFNGDWYDKSWNENPLEDCKKDAMQEMDYAYKIAMKKIEPPKPDLNEYYENKYLKK